MTHDELVRFAAGKVGTRHNFDLVQLSLDKWEWVPLSSPELLLKGMRTLGELELIISGVPEGNGWTVEIIGECVGKEVRGVATEDIPLTFWQCWAELEGGQG
ncbi:MAG: hypothetical protein R3B95_11795 [Nitrospirales bacterium]|nr:hypothetical protein [Nitrospirales bacterium]